jgi:nucleoside 2-deoxyribosyltransferase
MKFGDETLDQVFADCFRPAVARAGFELRKLIEHQSMGLIDNQVRAAIVGCRFVIADVTHSSDGAYWEAGYAEGLGLPVIYTCEASVWQDKETQFDANHMITVVWDASNLKKTEDDLTATIRATLRAEAKQSD